MKQPREVHSARFEACFLEHPKIKEALDLPIALGHQEIAGFRECERLAVDMDARTSPISPLDVDAQLAMTADGCDKITNM